MREVVFKNLTSAASNKRDVLLKEVFEKSGITARTERRSFYFVKNVTPIIDNGDLNRFIDSQNGSANMNGHRRFHIMKHHNDATRIDKLICKIAGTFYAVANNNIYTIAFLHSFKVSFVKSAQTG